MLRLFTVTCDFKKNEIRFALFTKSYAGIFIKEFIRVLPANQKICAVRRLAKILLINDQLLNCFIFHKTCVRRFSKIATQISKSNERIKVYLQIEKEIIILINEKKDKNNLTSEDYEYALLEPTIERVAGNRLAKIKDDGEFERKMIELIKTYKRFYYDIARKHRLPTLRIVPFIIRLITL